MNEIIHKCAIEENWDNMHYITEISEELCLQAIKSYEGALNLVPDRIKTHDFCVNAVKQNPRALRFVPKKLMSLDICLEAVKKNKESWRFIPKELEESVREKLNSEV